MGVLWFCGVFCRVLILLCFLCLAVLSYTGPTPMLEKRQMKLEESFPSESTPGKVLNRQLDGQLNGSSCIGQDLFVKNVFSWLFRKCNILIMCRESCMDREKIDKWEENIKPEKEELFSLNLGYRLSYIWIVFAVRGFGCRFYLKRKAPFDGS